MNEVMKTAVDVLTSDTSRQALQVTVVAFPYLLVGLAGMWALKQAFGVLRVVGGGLWTGVSTVAKGVGATYAYFSNRKTKKMARMLAEYTKLNTNSSDSARIEIGKPARIIANSFGAKSPVYTEQRAKSGDHIIPVDISGEYVHFRSADGTLSQLRLAEVVPIA